MFSTLNAEMARIGINNKQLAKRANMNYDTLLNKMGMKTEFTRSQMLSIKESLGVSMTLEELFAIDDELDRSTA